MRGPASTLGLGAHPREPPFPTGEPARRKNLRNVADTGEPDGGHCCQEDRPLELGVRRTGSPAWIRITIHGSHVRCSVMERPASARPRGEVHIIRPRKSSSKFPATRRR